MKIIRLGLLLLVIMHLVSACSIQKIFTRTSDDDRKRNNGLVLIGPVCETNIECQSDLSRELLRNLDELVKGNIITLPEELSDKLSDTKLESYEFEGENNDQWVLYRENYSRDPEKVIGTLEAQRGQGLHIFVKILETDRGEVSIQGFRFFNLQDGKGKIDEFLRIRPLKTNLNAKETLSMMLQQEIAKEYHSKDLRMEPYTGILMQKDSRRTVDTYWKSTKPINEDSVRWIGPADQLDERLKEITGEQGYGIDEQNMLTQAFRPEDSDEYDLELEEAKNNLESTNNPKERFQKALDYEKKLVLKNPFNTKIHEEQDSLWESESKIYQGYISKEFEKLLSESDDNDLDGILTKWRAFLESIELDDPRSSKDDDSREYAKIQIGFLEFGLRMKVAYEQAVDETADLNPKDAASKWERFKDEFGEDMPLQTIDDTWRRNADLEIDRLKKLINSKPLKISIGYSGQSVDLIEESGGKEVEINSFIGIQFQMRYFLLERVSLGLTVSRGKGRGETNGEIQTYEFNGEPVRERDVLFNAFTIAYRWGNSLDSWLGKSWAIDLGLGIGEVSAKWSDGTDMSQTGLVVDFGIEYLTSSNWIFTLGGVSLSGKAKGSHVEKLRENGIQALQFNAASSMIGIGYHFD